MIAFLEGTLKAKTADTAFVQVAGVGYAVSLPTSDIALLPATQERVFLYTYLQVKEDGLSLFGFLEQEEKLLFEKLITVSGVGPRVALAALSSFKPADLVRAITAQDIGLVSSIPGVGKKLASRMVLELKDKLGAFAVELTGPSSPSPSITLSQAQEALESMGFSTAEAYAALQGAPANATEAELIQFALKRIGA